MTNLTKASIDDLLYVAGVLAAKLEQPFCAPDHPSCKWARAKLAEVNAELVKRQAEPFKFTGMTDDGLACYEGVV
jgi:hypothetical protein